MKVLFDFAGMKGSRLRDIRKLGIAALCAERLGHDVAVLDQGCALERLPDGHPARSLPIATKPGGDVLIITDNAVARPRTRATVVLWSIDKKLSAYVPGYHEMLYFPHIPGDGVLAAFEEHHGGLALDAYLGDDLPWLRAHYDDQRSFTGRPGFIGSGQYGRSATMAKLKECTAYLTDSQRYSPTEYLALLSTFSAILDLPGQRAQTHRFAEAVMIGRPIACLAGVGESYSVPVNPTNAIAVRSWSDVEMCKIPGWLRICADAAYVKSWSLRAQVQDVLDLAVRAKVAAADLGPSPLAAAMDVMVQGDTRASMRNPPVELSSNPLTIPTPAASWRLGPWKPRVLIITDGPNWAYARRAEALVKYAPRRDLSINTVTTTEITDSFKLASYDVVFLLDYAAYDSISRMVHSLGEHRPKLIVSFNAGHIRRNEWWPKVAAAADWIVCVEKQRFENRGDVDHCCYLPNGYDAAICKPRVPIEDREDVVLWCGSQRLAGIKGYDEILAPLKRLATDAGFQCKFLRLGGSDTRRSAGQMAGWYNSGAYILCTSQVGSEGTPNTITEGVACGCVAVSSETGNIMDWGRPGENCIIIRGRTPGAFATGLIGARDHRLRLAEAGIAAIHPWRYAVHAKHYYELFRRVASGGAMTAYNYKEEPRYDTLR